MQPPEWRVLRRSLPRLQARMMAIKLQKWYACATRRASALAQTFFSALVRPLDSLAPLWLSSSSSAARSALVGGTPVWYADISDRSAQKFRSMSLYVTLIGDANGNSWPPSVRFRPAGMASRKVLISWVMVGCSGHTAPGRANYPAAPGAPLPRALKTI